MAKHKRQSRKNGSSAASAMSVVSTESNSAPSTQTTGFNPDYAYVVKDLRRIGILAGSFIVVLVAISFFLR